MAYNPTNPNGQASMANSSPVTIASDQSAIPVSGTVITTATNLDIRDLLFASDKVDVTGSSVKITDGVDTVDAYALSSTPVGTDIGLVTNSIIYGKSSSGGGTFVEVKVNPAGSMLTAIGDISGIDGQATMANSVPVVIASNQSAVPVTLTSTTITGTVAVTQSGTWNIGTVSTITNVVHVDDNGSTLSIDDGAGSITVDGTVAFSNTTIAVTNAGTFAVQDSQVVTDNAGFTDGTTKVFVGGYIYDEVAGTALTENDAAAARINVNRAQIGIIEDGSTRGRYATVTASNALKVDGSAVTQPVSLTSTTITGSVTVTGDVAHDAVDSGNPFKIGGYASANVPTSVAAGDRVNAWYGLNGAAMVSIVDNATASGNDAMTAYRVLNTSGGAGTSNPIASVGYNYNPGGTVFERTRSIQHALNTAGTGVTAAGLMAEFDDTSPTAITENQFGNLRISANRNLYNTIRDAAGNERGANVNASSELLVALSSVPTHAVTLTSTTITGTVAVTQSGTWVLGANSGVDIGDVTINNASGASAVNIQDGGNSITVDGTVAFSNTTIAVTNAGTFVVQENGAALTSLQLIDDVVYTDDTSTHSTGVSKGVGIMATATPTDASVNANDIGMVAMTTDRKLHVSVQDALPTGANVIGAVTQSGTWNVGTVTTITNVVHVDDNASTISIDDGAGSITVDGTVAATQSGNWSVRAQDGSGNALTSAARGSERALSVQLVDGSGTQVTSFGGGTQYTEGDTDASITGTAMLFEGAANTLVAAPGTAADGLLVNLGANNDVVVSATNLDIRNLSDTTDSIVVTGTLGVIEQITAGGTTPLTVAIIDAAGSQITSFGGGTQYTEDAVSAANPVGNMMMGVVDSNGDDTVSADGDNMAVRLNNNGAVYVYQPTNGTNFKTEASLAQLNGSGNTIMVDVGIFDALVVNLNDTNGTELQFPVDGSAAKTMGVHALGTDGTNAQILSTNVSGHLNIADGGNSITVDGTVAFSNTTIATTNAGTFVTQENGAALTSLQLIDDTVFTDDTSTHSTGVTKGQGIMAVANPTDASVDANDIGMLAMTTARALKNDITTIAGTAPTTAGFIDIKGADGNVFVRQATASNLNMTEASAASSLTSLQLIDDIVYTDDTSTHSTGVSKGALMMAAATPTDTAVNANDIGALAMTLNRELLVQVNTALPAGTNAIGKLSSNTGVTIGAVEIAAAQTLATVTTVSTVTSVTNVATIGTSVTPGTGAANLGKAEDAVAGSGDTGVFSLSVANEAQTTLAADGDYIARASDTKGNVMTVGNIAHDGVNAGNPMLSGYEAIAHGTNPTAVAAADRTKGYANRAGVPFVMGGHPNIVSAEYFTSGAITDDNILPAISTGTIYVITSITVTCSAANATSPSVRIGFGASTLTAQGATNADAVTKIILSHPGIPAGGGVQKGNGSGIVGIGGDGEELRITCTTPTTSMIVQVDYYTIAS